MSAHQCVTIDAQSYHIDVRRQYPMSEILNPSLTEVSRILKSLINFYDNISGVELSKKCGVPVSTINRILAGTVVDPKISTLKPLADYFGITVDQLLGYAALPEQFSMNLQKLSPTIALPVFGLNKSNFLSKSTKRWFTWVTEKQAQSKDVFAISIATEEFEPIFSKDSIIIIEPSMLPPQNDDYVALIFENNENISLRKYKITDNEHYLVPLNPQFKAVLCSEKKHDLLGVISEAHTKLRE